MAETEDAPSEDDMNRVARSAAWNLIDGTKGEFRLGDGAPNREKLIDELMRQHVFTGAASASDLSIAHHLETLSSDKRRRLVEAAVDHHCRVFSGKPAIGK